MIDKHSNTRTTLTAVIAFAAIIPALLGSGESQEIAASQSFTREASVLSVAMAVPPLPSAFKSVPTGN